MELIVRHLVNYLSLDEVNELIQAIEKNKNEVVKVAKKELKERLKRYEEE